MSTPEVDAARVRTKTDPEYAVASPRPRIRHHARDGLSVVAFSLGASMGVSALLWAVLHWLA